MHCKLQILFDQGLVSNTNALFEDCLWVKPYDITAESYCTCNSHEHTAQFQFHTLKIDKVSPVSIFWGPVVRRKGGVSVPRIRILTARATAMITTRTTALIKQQ